LGTTPVTFTAGDDSTNADSCASSVTVADTGAAADLGLPQP
jgi:hypothetical protein